MLFFVLDFCLLKTDCIFEPVSVFIVVFETQLRLSFDCQLRNFLLYFLGGRIIKLILRDRITANICQSFRIRNVERTLICANLYRTAIHCSSNKNIVVRIYKRYLSAGIIDFALYQNIRF